MTRSRALPKQRPGSTRTLLSEADGGLVRRTVLPGGLRVITEALPTVRSASIGIWAGIGSRDESTAQAGCSHYLEHLLFKGTARRDAFSITAAIDAVGGEINAFTTKEYTCYYARVLDSDVALAVDVLSDMVTSSLVNPTDVDSERSVILDEIAMHEDDPSDAVHEAFARGVYGNGPLGRPILGSVAAIQRLPRRTIWSYYRRHYQPDNLVIAAAGNIEHAAVVRLVKRAFKPLLGGDGEPRSPRRAGRSAYRTGSLELVTRPIEQANLVLGMPALSRTDDRRFALGVLNNALGGGMSSRLFQEIREKRGLAYSVYSYSSLYAGSGLFGVYAGCLPAKAPEVLELARAELQKVVDHGLTDDEVTRGKGQMRGSIVLNLEDTGSRMTRLGKAELVHGELLGVDEVIARIDAVNPDDVRSIAREVLGATPTLAVIGPFDNADRLAAAVA